MIKAYALDNGISITNITLDRTQLEELLADDPFAGMYDIVEIDYNDAPLTEVGEKIKEELVELMTKSGLTNFKMELGPKFYEKSADERMQYLMDIFTMDWSKGKETFKESDQPSVDLKDHLDEEGNLDVESLRATGAMICPVD